MEEGSGELAMGGFGGQRAVEVFDAPAKASTVARAPGGID